MTIRSWGGEKGINILKNDFHQPCGYIGNGVLYK